MTIDKQQHARRLKPIKTVLNPVTYQFIIWVINQKWGYTWMNRRITGYSRLPRLWKGK